MPRYIDTDQTDEVIKTELGMYDTTDLKEMLKYFPTADVAPVVHAHWRKSGSIYICDGAAGCGFCMPEEQWYNAHFACPACGAKMNEEMEQ